MAKGNNIAVFYDVDGTLLDSNIVMVYLYYALRLPHLNRRVSEFLKLLAMAPAYKTIDRFSRKRFNEVFYKRYKGMNIDRLKLQGEEIAHKVLYPNIYPEALERIAKARQMGYRQVLVTGSLHYMIAPLARILNIEDVITNRLEIDIYGLATGRLTAPVLADQGKEEVMQQYADEHDIDLSRSYAFADSKGDMEMLEMVGFPCVINPDKVLKETAQQESWPVLSFG